MKNRSYRAVGRVPVLAGFLLSLAVFSLLSVAAAAELSEELGSVGCKIVYETYQNDSWELLQCDADGSNAKNLTSTAEVNELYPHVSPDGTKVCFVVDEGEGSAKTRNLFWMKMDGSGRTLVAKNARQACWKADSSAIAYLKGEFEKFSYRDYATKGIVVYDLATGKHREHPNRDIHHLYNLCWSPDGKWFLATVHAGMGFKHAILAIEAEGPRVVNLNIPGCRPDVSPDGKQVAWGSSDWALRIGDLDFSGSDPKVTNIRDVVTSAKPMKIYHIDFSPEGKYVAYSRGPVVKRLGMVGEIVGIRADGWNICVADATKTNRWVAITTDGKSNKEPDWVSVEKKP